MNDRHTEGSSDPLVDLAVQTIDSYVRTGDIPQGADLPREYSGPSACFVSIHTTSTDELRGCIGTIEPTQDSLAQEIIQNAISASTRDPRFPPISVPELDDVTVNVDVLFPAEPAHIEELDPARYGVIVTQGLKRGLLLPDLDGVDTVDDQVSIACMKAGIDPRSHFDIERFEVIRHV